jgi:hypothetical protein
LAGRGRRAVQVTTAAAGQIGSRWPLAFRGVKLHKVLGFGELKLRSGPPGFWWLSGPDLERWGMRSAECGLGGKEIIRGSRGLFRSRPCGRR